jgi:hypothetical protein
VAGRVHGEGCHRADLIFVAILEKPVELAAVTLEFSTLVEDFPEGVLNDGDLLANADFAAQLAL